MRQVLRRVVGVGMVAGAIYAGVKLPSAYPFVFRETGVAVVTRSDVNKVAAAYCVIGLAGGLGVALALGLGKRR
jgi:ABC-type proline/glycine betaine transport system permease subunit